MKPYGHLSKERNTCPYGCCYEYGDAPKFVGCRKIIDKQKRKTARRKSKRVIELQLRELYLEG